jgi:hypothetical protein
VSAEILRASRRRRGPPRAMPQASRRKQMLAG